LAGIPWVDAAIAIIVTPVEKRIELESLILMLLLLLLLLLLL